MGFQQDVYVAIRDDGQTGTGTWSDPYDGSTATKFDAAMQTAVSGKTFRLPALIRVYSSPFLA